MILLAPHSFGSFPGLFGNITSKDKSADMNLIVNQNKNENSNEEKQINFLLGKKRKLFNINYSKGFFIFTEGEFNDYTIKIL